MTILDKWHNCKNCNITIEEWKEEDYGSGFCQALSTIFQKESTAIGPPHPLSIPHGRTGQIQRMQTFTENTTWVSFRDIDEY
jgi:hypothetical protein